MSNNIYRLIGSNIKYYRKKCNYTQLTLAELSGYSHEFIRRIEAPNSKTGFSIETVYIISKVLDVELWCFFMKRK